MDSLGLCYPVYCLLSRCWENVLIKIQVFMCVCLVAQSRPTLWDPMDCSPPGFSVHGDSPGKNIWVGCHALLQWIFPIQGLNPSLLHCRQILYHFNHQGSPMSYIYIWDILCIWHIYINIYNDMALTWVTILWPGSIEKEHLCNQDSFSHVS